MFKTLLVLSVIVAVAYTAPGVVPVVPVVHTPAVVHHGHSVHSHVVHHPAPVVHKTVVPVVPVVKQVVPIVPVVKPVVPVVPVHHVHPAVVVHH